MSKPFGLKRPAILYVVMTPPPDPKSAGITFLNALPKNLSLIGRSAAPLYSVTVKDELYIWAGKKIPTQNHYLQPWTGGWRKLSEGLLKDILPKDRCVVIHGENQHHKWFDGLFVVRYYLNKIGALRKVGVPREGEFKLAWDESFCSDPEFVLNKSMVRYDLNEAIKLNLNGRVIDLSYIGKGSIHNKGLKRLPSTIELHRNWPSNDEEYFYLLKNTRFLFTYDPISSTLADAVALGAKPVIIPTATYPREYLLEIMEKHYPDCHCFINEEQKLNQDTFSQGRRRFLDKLKRSQDDFLPRLTELCCLLERRFFNE